MVQVDLVALVPPARVNVMLDWPLVTRDVRMFSMEAAVRAQPLKVSANAPETRVPVVLNMFAGNEVRPVQLFQACPKFVPAAVLISGKFVRLEQPRQVNLKLVPAAVLSGGKLVRLEQPNQA